MPSPCYQLNRHSSMSKSLSAYRDGTTPPSWALSSGCSWSHCKGSAASQVGWEARHEDAALETPDRTSLFPDYARILPPEVDEKVGRAWPGLVPGTHALQPHPQTLHQQSISRPPFAPVRRRICSSPGIGGFEPGLIALTAARPSLGWRKLRPIGAPPTDATR
jgi:hypothetical protein